MRIGSAPDADVRIDDAEVVAEHALLEPAANGWRLVASAKVLVNGRAAQRAELSLGDRLEIGPAVAVFGTSVARAAQPEDVLAEAVVRRRRDVAPRRASGRALPIVAALAALGTIAYFVTQSDDSDRVRSEFATIARWQADGQLDRADAAIARLRDSWKEALDDRLVRLDAAAAHAQAIRGAVERIEGEIRSPEDGRSFAAWIRELQSREQTGDGVERVAARLARARLADTLLERPAAAAGDLAGPVPVEPEQPADTEGSRSQATAAATADAWIQDAARLAEQGLFTQADAAIASGLAEADGAESVARLVAERDRLHELAKAAMRELLAEAEALLADGKAREAITRLAGSKHRWPASEDYAAIAAALVKAEAGARGEGSVVAQPGTQPGTQPTTPQASQPVPPVGQPATAPTPDTPVAQATGRDAESIRLGTLQTLRAQLEQVRTAEERGDHATAARLLEEAAAEVRDQDPSFADRLAARAQEAGWFATWQTAVDDGLAKSKGVAVRMRDGSSLELCGVRDGRPELRGKGARGDEVWTDIDAASLENVANKLAVDGDARLGLANLLYRSGERERAEQVLARLLRSEAQRKVDVDKVIARGRGEVYDERGYTLQKDGFVSDRDQASQKLARSIGNDLGSALRAKDPAAWAAFLDRTLAKGPEVLDALALSLRTEFTAQVRALEASGARKQFDKLAALRADLDAARDHARSLIYDEVKYFYPYKPPAVSSDRLAEYNRVQAEVNVRVAALREVWRDESVKIRVPAALRGTLDRIDWLSASLSRLGHGDVVSQFDIGWARALPAGDSIGLREFCLDPAERADAEEWARIEAYNAVVEKQVPAAIREQLRITNAYRAMFRHRPLALVPTICIAAQGHADEMSKLGYFAHMSPTPGRKTPFDRMKLAGYTFGVTENIALNDSAQGAHDAWCRSSGHHRNLLNARHTEFGVGANGRYWVQNFGSGSTYLQAEAWREAMTGGKKR